MPTAKKQYIPKRDRPGYIDPRKAKRAAKNADPYACPVCNRPARSLCRCPEEHCCCELNHFWLARVGKKAMEGGDVTDRDRIGGLFWKCDSKKHNGRKNGTCEVCASQVV